MEQVLRALKENDGFTLKRGKPIHYKSGWQVATNGIVTRSIKQAQKVIHDYNGDCGVWYHANRYYVDRSIRVDTKRKAMEIGKRCNQLTILRWRDLAVIAVD